MEQSLDVIDRLWRGESVTADSDSFCMQGVRESPRPVQQPRIPVWLAAGWPRKRPLRRAALWDGVYLMTNNQLTEERLTPDEVAQAVAVIREVRGTMTGFDVGANVETLEHADGGVAITRAMEQAGATWVVELTPDTLDEHRALIKRGPSKD
jgi:alkanesulfonate monooxygenase SsuD/methylene tetrahydromethanopterin reductase-like flavin-dependent oxidoreductase (luciferase family)